MRRINLLLAAALGASLLTAHSSAQAAQASSASMMDDGGCRAAYNGGGWTNVYPCISKTSAGLRADAYVGGAAPSCSYYIVRIIWGNYDTVRASSSRQPCNRWHSDVVTYSLISGTPYRSKIQAYNSRNESILSLESPPISYP
ncbi:hypothetical protein Sru01_30220 [Sphaerisporangium rufum]|uniref:Uncharacterized protein n=1 Tax=Sphaerisporangium rufum TaxID=1381558 RepID=A0A919R479_9ACTN|nr:hypothetical protein Sru01_30220 [Sphaerisporangium rufum]